MDSVKWLVSADPTTWKFNHIHSKVADIGRAAYQDEHGTYSSAGATGGFPRSDSERETDAPPTSSPARVCSAVTSAGHLIHLVKDLPISI